MNADIIEQWEKNKNKFKEILKKAVIKKTFRYEYEFLLSIIIKHVINRDRSDTYKDLEYDLLYNEDDITKIQLGHYNGDYLFIVKPEYEYCSVGSLWVTKVFYGSCSGCDEMIAAEYQESDPKEKVDILMGLSLNIIQEFKPLSLLYPI